MSIARWRSRTAACFAALVVGAALALGAHAGPTPDIEEIGKHRIQNGGTGADNVPAALANLGIAGLPGAVGDGVTDDRAALAAALAAMPATGGVLYLGRGQKVRIASNLTIPANVTLDCQQVPGYASSLGGTSLNVLGGIRRDSTATITMSSGSRIVRCPLLQYGLTFPVQTPAAYAGTAVTWDGGDVMDAWLEDVLIVGAALCVDHSAGGDRFHMINVECDGVAGYKIGPSFDTSEMRQVRNWPWGTQNWNGGGSPTNARTGTGFLFTGTGRMDDLKGFGLLDYQHATSMDIQNPGGTCCNMHLDNVWLDGNTTQALRIAAGNVTFGKVWLWPAALGIVLSNGGAAISDLYISGGTTGMQFSTGSLHVGRLNTAGQSVKLATLSTTSDRLRVMNGSVSTAGVAPYITLPASPATMPSDAVTVNVTSDAALFADSVLLPQRSVGTAVAAVAGVAAPYQVISGTGQSTGAITDSGAMGGTLLLNDTAQLSGSGGALLFGGNSASMRHFGAIKGSLSSGSSNTTGDILFSTRAAVGDTALTERLRIDSAGLATITGSLSVTTTGLFASNVDVTASTNGNTYSKVTNANAGAAALALQQASNGTSSSSFGKVGTNYTTNGLLIANWGIIDLTNTASGGAIGNSGNAPLAFFTNGYTNERLRITEGGLIAFGGGATASFPALKRSTTTLQHRLADDSADAPISASNATLSGALGLPTTSFANNATCATTLQFLGADASYIYVCTSANTVKRAALAAF